jgi:hypothetical protein
MLTPRQLVFASLAIAMVLAGVRPSSAVEQPPDPEYDADMLADRRAAIAAVLKAGGLFTDNSRENRDDIFPPERDYFSLHLIAATKTDVLLAKLASLSELQVLNLNDSDVTDAGLSYLAALKNLESLDLTGTAIDDAGLQRLKPLTALWHVGLRGTQITAAGLKALRELPNLVSVDVRETAVTPSDLLVTLPQVSPRGSAAILAALKEKTEIDFKNQPLTDVIEYLKERHEIEIAMDVKSLEDEGISTDTPITCQSQGITLREALATMLDPLDLGFVVRHEVLLIAAKPIKPRLHLPEVPPGEALSPALAKALLRPSPLTVVDQPLSEVVEYLKAAHGIEIEIDQRSLADAGIGTDTPVTRNVSKVSLKSCLELLLSELDLTCVAKGDKLIIRSRD